MNKNLLYGLGLLTMTSCYTQENKVFNGKDNYQYQLAAHWLDENQDGKVDGLLVQYDFNKDKKMDAMALYLVGVDGLVNPDAYSLILDNDYDGEPDVIYTDLDGDGTLEDMLELDGAKVLPIPKIHKGE